MKIQRHGLLGAVAPVALEDPIEGLITALERRAGLEVAGIGFVGRGMNPSRGRGEEAADPVRRVEPQDRPGLPGAGLLDEGFDESGIRVGPELPAARQVGRPVPSIAGVASGRSRSGPARRAPAVEPMIQLARPAADPEPEAGDELAQGPFIRQ